jgi:hypothetical protein
MKIGIVLVMRFGRGFIDFPNVRPSVKTQKPRIRGPGILAEEHFIPLLL